MESSGSSGCWIVTNFTIPRRKREGRRDLPADRDGCTGGAEWRDEDIDDRYQKYAYDSEIADFIRYADLLLVFDVVTGIPYESNSYQHLET